MSEIPIGSPPAPPGRHAAPPGWYSDPVDRSQERYWDGWQWSRTTRIAAGPATGQPQPGPTGQGHPGQQGQYGQGQHGQHGQYGQGHGQGSWGQPGPTGQSGSAQGLGGSRAVSGPGGGFATSAPGTQAMLTADGVPMAAWGFRALAAVIDLIMVGIVTLAACSPFYAGMYSLVIQNVQASVEAAQRGLAPPASPTMDQMMAQMTSTDRLMVGLITGVIGVAYFGLMWRLRSASVGQLICGLRVVPVDHGQGVPKISWGSAILRALVWVVPRLNTVLLLFWMLNCLFPLWNSKRQALHDLAARTQVIKIR